VTDAVRVRRPGVSQPVAHETVNAGRGHRRSRGIEDIAEALACERAVPIRDEDVAVARRRLPASLWCTCRERRLLPHL